MSKHHATAGRNGRAQVSRMPGSPAPPKVTQRTPLTGEEVLAVRVWQLQQDVRRLTRENAELRLRVLDLDEATHLREFKLDGRQVELHEGKQYWSAPPPLASPSRALDEVLDEVAKVPGLPEVLEGAAPLEDPVSQD